MKYLRLCFFVQGVAVTKTGFKRCTRPSATLIMAVGNVVLGRVQRTICVFVTGIWLKEIKNAFQKSWLQHCL